MLIEHQARRFARGWCCASGREGVRRHPQLVGVDHIKRIVNHQAAQLRKHIGDPIARDEDRLAIDEAARQRSDGQAARTADWAGDQAANQAFQVTNCIGRIAGAHKCGQGNVVTLGQVLEDMVCADLWTGVQRIGQYLGQE
jgi:hypothetical protein